MTWLNYHHLFYFKTIATEGTVAKAAEKLRLGQPTLSTQLKQFEETIGHSLFDRRQKRLHLTEAGRVALEYANEIFKLGDEMMAALGNKLSLERLEVAIGAMDTVAKQLTLRLVERAQSLHNNCIISITEGQGDELIRELKAHRIDLLLANYPPPVTEGGGLFARCVAKMPVVVCGSAKYAGLRENFPISLQDQPFVMPTLHSRLRHDVEHFLKFNQIRVQMVVEVQDTSLQKLLGSHGVGLIPVAAPAVSDLVKNHELIVIGELKNVFEELWLAAGERRIQNSIAASLMKDFNI
jgi:LysR family transcriptional activator of nhaA